MHPLDAFGPPLAVLALVAAPVVLYVEVRRSERRAHLDRHRRALDALARAYERGPR